MASIRLKRYAYILRRSLLLPLGVVIMAVGIGIMAYFLTDYLAARQEVTAQGQELSGDVDVLLERYPDWPNEIRDKINQFQAAVQSRDLNTAISLAAELRVDPLTRTNRDVFFLKSKAELMLYAEDERSKGMNYVLGAGGIILLGLGGILGGLVMARRAGRYISTHELMGNLKKLEMPEFSSAASVRKLNVDSVSLFIVVNKFGFVTRIDLLDGPSVILPYLTRAISKWRFDPFLYKGERTEVFGEVKINLK